MKKSAIVTLCLIVFCFTAVSVHAHMLWLTPGSRAPEPAETVEIMVGFGHHFPQGKMEKQGRLQGVYAVAPDGDRIACKSKSPSLYTFAPEQKGIYWIYTALKPGFVSNTTTGRKLGNKQTLEGVVACFAFRISAATPIRCGDAGGYEPGKGEHKLEIFPVQNPAGLGANDTLDLKVVFEGKPLAGASVVSASAAESGRKEHGASETLKTNARRIVSVKLTSGGPWMFTARHKTPYPDKLECDSFSYSTSLTLDF